METIINLSAAKQEVWDLLAAHSDVIHESAHKTFGLNGWFTGFLQSRMFSDLDNETKAEAFELYRNLSTVLSILDSMNISQE